MTTGNDFLDTTFLDAMRPPDFDGPTIPDLEDQEAPELEDALTGWEITDLDNATWAARNLARRQRRLDTIRAHAARERARIDEWEAGETGRLERDVAFFESRLEAFHRDALAKDPRGAKTIKLPDGTHLRSQAGKLAVEVTDIEAFARWVEESEQDGLLRYAEPEVEKAAVAARFGGKADREKAEGNYPAVIEETGETVPGVEIVRRPRTYKVSPPPEEGTD